MAERSGYRVKSIFHSLQGEGAHTGRPAVFCRFAECNLWSGREEDRAAALCGFCDTDFVGGEIYAAAEDLAEAVARAWRGGATKRYAVLTGGEPLLQVDAALVDALHDRGFAVGVETNGTVAVPVVEAVDWVCVSPKAKARLKLTVGDELKLVFPQEDCRPEDFEHLAFAHFFLQPRHEPERDHTASAVAYCARNPRWRLSLQTHKLIGIP